MEQVYIQEVNKEILIVLDTNYPTKLSALQEASRVLQREIIRETQGRQYGSGANGNVSR